MPLKSGKLTRQEAAIARAMAELGHPAAVAHKLGVPAASVRAALARPAVRAETINEQLAILVNEGLPAAVRAAIEMVEDPKTPAGARGTVIKVIFDRTLGADDAGKRKEPHEMSKDELDAAIADLTRLASDKAKLVIDHAPAEHDIFG